MRAMCKRYPFYRSGHFVVGLIYYTTYIEIDVRERGMTIRGTCSRKQPPVRMGVFKVSFLVAAGPGRPRKWPEKSKTTRTRGGVSK